MRRYLPERFYRLGVALWRSVRTNALYLESIWLGGVFAWKYFRLPDWIIHFGEAPGDDLLCTTVLYELRRRNEGTKIFMVSNFPEIFSGGGDAIGVLPVGRRYESFAQRWKRQYRRLEYARYIDNDRTESPRRHIAAELCARVGIEGAVAIRPYIHLTSEDKGRAAVAVGKIAIQSSGMGGRLPMLNKQWFPDRFQAVVDSLRGEYDFIQLGSTDDPPLQHVSDFRGSTSIREAASLLFHARLYIGTVGFLMHLARAVDCPSVIIFGGREAPWQSGYICNINLHTTVPCAPCWRRNHCDIARKCMNEITGNDVVAAVRELACKPRSPLAVETIRL